MASARGMALGLGQLRDVKERGLVLSPHTLDAVDVSLDQRWVIPAGHDVDVDPRTVVWSEAAQHIRDRGLCRLGGDRHRNAVAVVPYRQRNWHLKHADGVYRLPKWPLARRRVTDGAESDLV